MLLKITEDFLERFDVSFLGITLKSATLVEREFYIGSGDGEIAELPTD